MEQYIIGDRNPPFWCKERITPYKKMNGTIGYEFYGRDGTLALNKGDRLFRSENGKDIFVRKRG